MYCGPEYDHTVLVGAFGGFCGPFWVNFWPFLGLFVAFSDKFSESSIFFAGSLGSRSSLLECMAGHTNSSSVKDTVPGVLRKLQYLETAKTLLTKIRVAWGPGDWTIFTPDQIYLTQKRINYPHNCYTLDISNHTRGKLVQTISFFFKSSHGKIVDKVHLLVQGKGIETNRDVYDNMFLSSGDAIETQPGKLTKYALEINQKVFVEEDKSKKCRNYPNEDFDSYAACDEKFMKSVCEAAKLSPIWLEEDINKVTEQTSVNIKGKI